MPFYTWLRPNRGEDPELAMKRRTAQKILDLRAALDAHIAAAPLSGGAALPSDTTKVVRIATWNLREFDSASYGYRSREAKSYIAEILSYFDLIALQEIRRDMRALDDVKRLLGPNWGYVATDVTEGDPGNEERMAFLFNRNKVDFRDVAGELTLPRGQQVTDPFGERFMVPGGPHLSLLAGTAIQSPEDLKTSTVSAGKKLKQDVEIALPPGTRVELPSGSTVRFAEGSIVPMTAADAIEIEAGREPTLPEAAEIVLPPNSLVGGAHQFARTPFVASFQAGWLKINLATVHIYYGEGAAGIARRTEEIARLTRLLAERARSDSDSDADSYFIALGDFNIVGPGHQTMGALTSNDFEIPQPLQSVPGSNVKKDKFYDQIALWTGESRRRRSYTQIRSYRAGVFDYFETVFRSDEEAIYKPSMVNPRTGDLYKDYGAWRTYQMSDHLPMWVELHIDFAPEYLTQVGAELDARLAPP
jgi:hypothetical protein